jgi:hypothetical protein
MLRGHVSGAVAVSIAYVNQTGRGHIRIQVGPEALVDELGRPEAMNLKALVPLTQTVAFYRDWVAGNFDLRIHNFDIGLDITPPKGVCKMTVVGDPPPDGTEFAPCIEVDGTAYCGELSEGVLRLPTAYCDAVAKCF